MNLFRLVILLFLAIPFGSGCIKCLGQSSSKFTHDSECMTGAEFELSIKPSSFTSHPWDNLDSQQSEELQLLSEWLNNHELANVAIGVHLDYRDADKFLKELSDRQAGAFFDLLKSKGCRCDNVEVIGFGETLLLFNEAAIEALSSNEEKEAAHQANNRLVLRIVSVRN
jgi:hypothetical protein